MPRGERKHRSSIRALTSKDNEEDSNAKREAVHKEDTDGEVPTIHRQVVLTPTSNLAFDDVIRLISQATGSRISMSHFFRAVLKVISHARPELEKALQELGKVKRPKNVRGEEARREDYERKIARAILDAIKASKPFR
jgi:hypothetical protein